jgi:hypothetical protein
MRLTIALDEVACQRPGLRNKLPRYDLWHVRSRADLPQIRRLLRFVLTENAVSYVAE